MKWWFSFNPIREKCLEPIIIIINKSGMEINNISMKINVFLAANTNIIT